MIKKVHCRFSYFMGGFLCVPLIVLFEFIAKQVKCERLFENAMRIRTSDFNRKSRSTFLR